ncbi:hypothetical protein [Brevundimonas sp.]|uniref:hypothetical protein n=1 Tax=Brevundimonas sp. TaxID=1871086 RepID=UPI0025CC1F05|nr:hypothetical protein [Brevundimonas sp.]
MAYLELAAGVLVVVSAILAGRQAIRAARASRKGPTLAFGALSPILALAGVALIGDALVRLLVN